MRKIITLAEAGDVLTTALEGGIGYWSEADLINRDPDLTVLSVRLHDADAGEGDEPEFPPTVVTRQMVKDAWLKVAEAVAAGDPPFGADYVQQMHDNTVDPGDAGGVDAGVADCIVQIAIMGKVVFG